MSELKKYIFSQVANSSLSKEEAKKLLTELQGSETKNKDIAIIGMAGRLPGGSSKEAFWSHIIRGSNLVGEVPEARKETAKYYMKHVANKLYPDTRTDEADFDKLDYQKQAYFEQLHEFDASFFGISPREAAVIDPVQRIFLEETYAAIEDAGYGGDKILGTNTGVFVGRNHTKSLTFDMMVEKEPLGVTGTWTGILSSRISYLFDLKGPSIVLDTACSSGLVSVYQACAALRSGECDMALAGGVSGVNYRPVVGVDSSLETYESADNVVKTFDDRANGTVWGEGAGVVMLKPLEKALRDGDQIHAVIKGYAANNDGRSNGYTAPNALAQEEMLVQAWKDAGIQPDQVNYIEAHGTGTALGDPIETKALTNAFRRFTRRRQFCAIGTAKSNMGHLVGASGVAGLIKVAMALQEKKIPASINFEKPNQFIPFVDSPLYVASELMPWERHDDKPRTAGVSSFGFSGTNCHLVLQEAPEDTQTTTAQQAPASTAYLFPISAKTSWSFEQLFKSTLNAIDTLPDTASIGDVCCSAALGRGHYNYRGIFVVESVADLRHKLRRVMKEGLEQARFDWFLYGSHKLVSESKKQRHQGELTESEKKGYTEQARGITNGALPLSVIQQTFLASYYVQGADVAFDQLFTGQHNSVRLPVYPYDRQPYWPEPSMIDAFRGAQEAEPELHPLLGKLAVSTQEKDIFTTRLSLDRHWQLTEHLVLGQHVLPGTAYIEMLKAISDHYWPEGGIEIKNLVYLVPLVVMPEQTDYEVQFFVVNQGEQLDIKVVSHDGSEWRHHAQAELHRLPQQQPEPVDWTALKLGKEYSIKEPFSSQSDFSFGPRWLCFDKQWLAPDERIHNVKLSDQHLADLDDYYLHTSLLDQAANGFIQAFIPGEMFLPYMYGSMKIFAPLPREFFTVTRLNGEVSDEKETLSFNLLMCDDAGQVLVEVRDYIVKRVDRKRFSQQNDKSRALYRVDWQADSPAALPESLTGTVVMLTDGSAQSQQLKPALQAAGANVVEIRQGQAFAEDGASGFTVGASEADYQRLLEHLAALPISQFVYCGGLDAQLTAESTVSRLFFLIKAMVANKLTSNIALTVLTGQAHCIGREQAGVNAYGRALEGLSKTIRMEYGGLVTRVVDVDPETSAHLLVAEVANVDGPFSVAYRGEQRYLPQFTESPQDEPAQQPLTLKESGCYVITGGSGGLALETAIHLASRKSVNLVLLSRSALVEGEPRLEKVFEAISTIEAAGSRVSYLSADVTDEASLEAALQQARKLYGRVNGVFHCAGVAGDGFLMNKDAATFERVVAPKTVGTRLLDKLTRSDAPDVMVFYSSITALFAGQGQGDYAAANAFLDGYAEDLALQGRKVLSINWAPWMETGMAVDFGVGSGEGTYLFGLDDDTALSLLDTMLDSSQPVLCGGKLNLKTFAERDAIVPLAEPIARQVSKIAGSRHNAAAGEAETEIDASDINLSGVDSDDVNEDFRLLGAVWASTLGLKDIDIYDTFTSLGGDSILAIELQKGLEKAFPGAFDITDIYSYPSVAMMAERLAELAAPPQEVVQATSEDALMAMLDGLDSGEASIDDILQIVD
ncbi:hypothetical protein RJ45_22490 [Photobacterium gaetbulicola]|uniref:Uncharacterized protein n=1 Tax=Photobacterium gaetbulicola TaxID=1295392 RepID=A0A0B9GXX4_9GAMM|nr:SDR family NAD(P)-dependent oxidoreductase [Photobacterium gaetbulicola]KHT61512.1 hypothetical protein RJ45_22490 [Photobacterium gaetbulicola]